MGECDLHIIAKQVFALKDLFPLLKHYCLRSYSLYLVVSTHILSVRLFLCYQLTFHFCWMLSDGDGL